MPSPKRNPRTVSDHALKTRRAPVAAFSAFARRVGGMVLRKVAYRALQSFCGHEKGRLRAILRSAAGGLLALGHALRAFPLPPVGERELRVARFAMLGPSRHHFAPLLQVRRAMVNLLNGVAD